MPGLTHASVWQQVESLLPKESLQTPPSLCVAFSGGLDSTVLLQILSELHREQPSRFSLRAIHINHQLQAGADMWSAFCQNFCEKRQLAFQVFLVNVTESKKKGIEAAARQARYAAFKKTLSSSDILLTAHHLDDQVETVFLQLLRGAGLDGAAAIAPISHTENYCLMRPLLTFERKQLLRYAQENKLDWIDDPSNLETHFKRNHLRQEILPALELRWPAYRKTIQRFANHARASAGVLNDYLAKDFVHCFDEEKKALNIEPLKNMLIEKRLMLIRYWFKYLNCSMPGEAVLMQIHSIIFADADANPLVQWGAVELRRYQRQLYLLRQEKQKKQWASFEWDFKSSKVIDGLGVLNCQPLLGQGIGKAFLNKPVKVMFRQGGERCSPLGRKGRHRLKKLFQEYGIPPWQRDRIPLLIIDDQIAAVVGLFYCAPFAVRADETGVIISLELDLNQF